MATVEAIKDQELNYVEPDDVDYELMSADQLTSPHVGAMPMRNAVQPTRLFYGSRFYNQALPLAKPEAPWVQALMEGDKQGRSFDDYLGSKAGALRAKTGMTVRSVGDDHIEGVDDTGAKVRIPLYKSFAYNRKSGITQTPTVKPGDVVAKDGLLAKSSYTDDNGTLAMGVNARVGIVPYKGYSMDDAIVISQAMANRLRSLHTETHAVDFKARGLKGGLDHFRSIFPETFHKDQLSQMDEDGIVKVGTIVHKDDPLVLASQPRNFNSSTQALGQLHKVARTLRADASTRWDSKHPGKVVDIARNRDGSVKVVVESERPTEDGDKLVFRTGNKGITSYVVPDAHMPRTADGRPLEVLLNPMGIPSRANSQLPLEIMLGKVAEKLGKPIKNPGFNKGSDSWIKYVRQQLAENGLSDKEEVFDPRENRKLENPITVGSAYLMKLHHTGACYDDQTEVLSERGWLLWNDVTPDDALATSDERGQDLLFEKPLHLFKYHYEGNLCAFSGRYVDYAVTPNHNMWQKPYYGQRTFSLRQASQLQNTRFKVKQFGLIPRNTDARVQFTIGAHKIDWGDFCEFTGWWVTEGCVGTNKAYVVVYQSSTANPGKVARIEALLQRMGVRWSYYKQDGVVMGFHILEKSFATYFSNYGGHSQFKRMPREIVTGPVAGCLRAIESMLLGDGHRSETTTGPSERLHSTSKQLVDDFQEMAVRAGAGSIVRPVNRDTVKFIENPHYLDAWTASYTTSRAASQVDGDRAGDGFSMPAYNGYVYCAEMRTGLLYVRRNGKPMLCGNSKTSSRGQASYDLNEQPTKGGGEGGQSKRLSGLEVAGMISSGAYANLRESVTLRGQKNDQFWRTLRAGQTPKAPGKPFVFEKFRALLNGAGLHARDMEGGKLRLGLMTDKVLDRYNPMPVRTGDIIDFKTLTPKAGGLFDPTLTTGNRWGYIPLPEAMPNPAAEEQIRHLLNLTRKDFYSVLAGEKDLET